MRGPQRQREVYIEGAGGRLPRLPIHPTELEIRASQVMSRRAFAYVAGGAGVETSVAFNRRGFDDWAILPRMLNDVAQRSTEVKLFGRTLAAPLFLCPIGVLEMAHPGADLAVAEAAASRGIPMIFSNQASYPMEQVAARMGDGTRWFQLYWSKSNELVESLVARAENCGCSAIVVTLDTTLLGWRIQDLELAYLPFLHGLGIAQYVSDPVFQRLLEEPDDEPSPPLNLARLKLFLNLCRKYPGDFWQNLRSKRPLAAVRKFIQIYSRPSLTWTDLSFLRDRTRLPIVLKGILDPEDARRALNHGVDGIYVSNHGGRQVDGSITAIEALPEVVEAVDGRAPVLFDSGIRGGADMLKALALGAAAVGLGRPYVYGLALAGRAGVEEVVDNLLADFDLTMGLVGCAHPRQINRDRLRRRGPTGLL